MGEEEAVRSSSRPQGLRQQGTELLEARVQRAAHSDYMVLHLVSYKMACQDRRPKLRWRGIRTV